MALNTTMHSEETIPWSIFSAIRTSSSSCTHGNNGFSFAQIPLKSTNFSLQRRHRNKEKKVRHQQVEGATPGHFPLPFPCFRFQIRATSYESAERENQPAHFLPATPYFLHRLCMLMMEKRAARGSRSSHDNHLAPIFGNLHTVHKNAYCRISTRAVFSAAPGGGAYWKVQLSAAISRVI